MRVALVAFSGILGLTACGSVSSQQDAGSPPAQAADAGQTADAGGIPDAGQDSGTDAGQDAGEDAGEDAGTEPGELLHGTRFDHYLTPSGTVPVPRDISDLGLKAWRYDGNAFTATTVTDTGDGGFVIPAAGGEKVYVETNTAWFVVGGRTLDLGRDVLGRSDVTPFDGGAIELDVTLSDQVSWGTDLLWLVSPETGEAGIVELTPPVPAGATGFTAAGTYDSHMWRGAVEPSRGDTAYVLHTASLYDTALGWYITTRSATHLSNVQLSTTAVGNVTGSLSALAGQISLDVRFSDFAALASKVHPQATPGLTFLSITPVPHGLDRGHVRAVPPSFERPYRSGATSDVSTTASYGDPFPAKWGRMAEVVMTFRKPLMLPGTTPSTASASIRVRVPAADLSTGVAPAIEPARQLTIDGLDATVAQTIAGALPKIAWQAPAVGVADAYFVTIHELSVSNGTTFQRVIAQLTTRDTTLRVPPGILARGKSYSLSVTAVAGAAPWGPESPFYAMGVGGHASAFSDIFTIE